MTNFSDTLLKTTDIFQVSDALFNDITLSSLTLAQINFILHDTLQRVNNLPLLKAE